MSKSGKKKLVKKKKKSSQGTSGGEGSKLVSLKEWVGGHGTERIINRVTFNCSKNSKMRYVQTKIGNVTCPALSQIPPYQEVDSIIDVRDFVIDCAEKKSYFFIGVSRATDPAILEKAPVKTVRKICRGGYVYGLIDFIGSIGFCKVDDIKKYENLVFRYILKDDKLVRYCLNNQKKSSIERDGVSGILYATIYRFVLNIKPGIVGSDKTNENQTKKKVDVEPEKEEEIESTMISKTTKKSLKIKRQKFTERVGKKSVKKGRKKKK